MGLLLTIELDQARRAYKVDSTELAAVIGAGDGNTDLQNALETAFGSNQDGEPRTLRLKQFIEALETLSDALSSGLRVTTYWIIATPMPGIIPPGSCSGAGGILINGEYHYLSGGVETCTLERLRIDENGRGTVVETTDVRNVSKIQTDNFGQIKIQKRRKPGRLLMLFRRLKGWLKSADPNSECKVTIG